jgi:hypothetical protein
MKRSLARAIPRDLTRALTDALVQLVETVELDTVGVN